MPACFQLISKKTKKAVPFSTIDIEICQHLNVECHPTQWYFGWYDCIGFELATGGSWESCKEIFNGLDDIIDFLEENYTYKAWRENSGFAKSHSIP